MSGSVADGVGSSVPIGALLRPGGELSPALLVVTGPFFLGFALEYFGMGLILVLGIQYLVSLRNEDRRPAPGLERHSRIGPTLVILSLGFNALQLIFDLLRGWTMFAKNFLDIYAFATPNYIWFVSPLLGLFPALITQAFLLRRITLFLSSLSSLWPALDRSAVKMTFVVVMTGAIVVSFLSGCIGSYFIWKSGPLWDDFVRESNVSVSSVLHPGSRVADLIWLSTSSAVDIILSMVLSFELWWARRKLAAKGGMLAKVTWQLLLVTFHGGVAVTALQLTALFLFEYKRAAAYCYLPILFAPKIYTLTLLLSLTLPQGNKSGHSASHVFSLPTIETSPQYQPHHHHHQHSIHQQNPTTSLTHRRSSPSRTTPVLPSLKLGSVAFATGAASSNKDRDRDRESKDSRGPQRKSAKSGLSSVVAKSWRLSQEWLTWSLLAGEDGGTKDTDGEKVREKEKAIEKGDKMSTGHGAGSKWKNADQDYAHSPLQFARDKRRPSEPNSLAPLLPLTPGSDLSLTYASLSTPQSLPTGSYPYDQPRTPLHPFHTSYSSTTVGFGVGNGIGNGVMTPEASVTVSRQHSFSTGRSSLSLPGIPGQASTNLNPYSQNLYAPGGVSSPSPRAKAPTPLVFNTINPFATLPRSRTRSKPLDPIQSEGRLEDEYRAAAAGAQVVGAPMDRDEDDDSELEPPRRPGTRGRLMSFEDMLGGPPPEPRKGSGSGAGSGSGSSPGRWR